MQTLLFKELNIGDIVTHKLSCQRMRIKILAVTVATCELMDEEPIWSRRNERYEQPRVVCLIENLFKD